MLSRWPRAESQAQVTLLTAISSAHFRSVNGRRCASTNLIGREAWLDFPINLRTR